ncbi:uncharacterized protein LOC111308477 [Durio zibethinus]|uniref:Uncharacterized protein LOC111308477 n=1 Tax=Durio zibethinus TaxID=66656 RepID=A0A6P6ACK2_DURZI|nr:uncharacterized protein LOC111308477 [Durio zibethinus]
MDDSFKLRVEKIFGSLQSSSLQQQQQRPPLWSLTGDEVERREWRRESSTNREDTLCSSLFDEFLKDERKYRSGRRKQLEDDLDNDGDSSHSRGRRIDGDGEEWEIRSCLGMDSTLDNEEEEDEYDKVASGRENAGERLYMSDIADHGSFLNSHNVLHSALNHTSNKDLRASCMAARIRLKEDDEAAWKLNYRDRSNAEIRESDVKESDNGSQLRSILKRKDNSIGFKPQKHVRFESAYKNDLEEPFEKFEDYLTATLPMNFQDSNGESVPAENAHAVPDYILNPSRYTRYSFDSSNKVDEESNAQAFMYLLKRVPNSKSTESLSDLEDAPRDLPKSVTFIPKRKLGNVKLGSTGGEIKEKEDACKKLLHPTRLPVGIAAGTNQHSKDGAAEDDEAETSAADSTAVIQKGGRSYRVKSQPYDSESESDV